MSSPNTSEKFKCCINCNTNYSLAFLGVYRNCECGLCIPDMQALEKAIDLYGSTLESLKKRRAELND